MRVGCCVGCCDECLNQLSFSGVDVFARWVAVSFQSVSLRGDCHVCTAGCTVQLVIALCCVFTSDE
jgi:hypothetical protein